MIFGSGIDIAIGILLAMVLAEHLGLAKKAERAFKWIGAGTVSFLIAGVFEAVPFVASWVTSGSNNYGFIVFGLVGFMLVTVGALWAIYNIMTE